jgi:YihY family inner membrane protein
LLWHRVGYIQRVNPLQKAAQSLDAFQKERNAIGFLFGITKKFGDDNGGALVSNLAYSAFLALFPLLLLLVTVLELVLSGHPALRRTVLNSALGDFPVVGRQLSANIHALHRSSIAGLAIGLLGLLWGATGFSQAGLFAMARVWNVPGPRQPSYVARLGRGLGFLAVIGIGLAISGFLAAFGTFGRHNVVLGLGAELVAVAVNIGQYVLAFRLLTPTLVQTRKLLPGAVAGGIAWTVLLALGGYLLGHDLRHDSAVYGIFGVVIGLLAWVYLGVKLSMYAAEVNVVLARRLWPRSLVQPPLTEADQKSLVLQASQVQKRADQKVMVTFDNAIDGAPEKNAS